MKAIPLSLKEANALIETLHRHHKPVRGYKFGIGVEMGGQLVGAVTVGRPVSREIDYRKVCEATRLVTDGTPHTCSFLYARAARAAQAMGYERIQTYILDSEPGTSLKAAGWEFDGYTRGGDWNCKSRGGRRTDQPQGRKQRWKRDLV